MSTYLEKRAGKGAEDSGSVAILLAYCRWPCFGRGGGLDDPQRALPTPTILWFCDYSCSTGNPSLCKPLCKPLCSLPPPRDSASCITGLKHLVVSLIRFWVNRRWQSSPTEDRASELQGPTLPLLPHQERVWGALWSDECHQGPLIPDTFCVC